MLAEGQPATAAGVRLRPNRTVIKNHFWLGVGKTNDGAALAAPGKTAPGKAEPVMTAAVKTRGKGRAANA
jgi:hypothetical protein